MNMNVPNHILHAVLISRIAKQNNFNAMYNDVIPAHSECAECEKRNAPRDSGLAPFRASILDNSAPDNLSLENPVSLTGTSGRESRFARL